MKKEVSLVRKKIDSVNKELKPLGQTCQKKVKHATYIYYLHKILGFGACFYIRCMKWKLITLLSICLPLGGIWHPTILVFGTGEGIQRSSWGVQWKEQGKGSADYQIDGGEPSNALWIDYSTNWFLIVFPSFDFRLAGLFYCSWWVKVRSWGWRSWKNLARA